MNFLIIFALSATFGVAILMLLEGVEFKSSKRLTYAERLASLELTDTATNIVEAELALPFRERIVRPISVTFNSFLINRTPKARIAQIEKLITQAGSKQKASSVMMTQLVGMVAVGATAFLISIQTMSGVMFLLTPLAGVFLGYYFPIYSLKSKAKKRQQLLLEALPNALDLLTIGMEAGQTFQAAVEKVVEKYDTPLSNEFAKVLNEIQLGSPQDEALLRMALRSGVEEIRDFCQSVVQMEKLGASLAPIMRIKSEELRKARRARAREAGAKAPVKMLLPMVGCIFPTIFIILLGPAILEVFHMTQ